MELQESVRQLVEMYRDAPTQKVREAMIQQLVEQHSCSEDEANDLFELELAEGGDKVDLSVELQNKADAIQVDTTSKRTHYQNKMDIHDYLVDEYRNLLAKLEVAQSQDSITVADLAALDDKVPHTRAIDDFMRQHGLRPLAVTLQAYLHKGGIIEANLLAYLREAGTGVSQTKLFQGAKSDAAWGYDSGKERKDAKEALNRLIEAKQVVKVPTQGGVLYYAAEHSRNREDSKHRRLYETIVDLANMKGKAVSLRALVCELHTNSNPSKNMMQIWKGPLSDLVTGGMVKEIQRGSRCYYEV